MADTAVCPVHPTESAIGNCSRCGAFVCHLDAREVDGKRYCEACAARPDVDWIEGFKRQHWGKRDGWAWLFGIGALPQAVTGVALLTDAEARAFAVFPLAAAVAGALWWAKISAARWLTVGVPVALFGFLAVTQHPLWILGGVIPVIILTSVVLATRTKLFFELDVPREKVKAMWDVYANNLVARYALSLGIVGVIIPPFAPIALACGVIGLSRVNPTSQPPIGRKGSAIAGIALGLVGIGVGAAIVLGNR